MKKINVPLWTCPRCGGVYQFPAAPYPGSGGKAQAVDEPCTACRIKEKSNARR